MSTFILFDWLPILCLDLLPCKNTMFAIIVRKRYRSNIQIMMPLSVNISPIKGGIYSYLWDIISLRHVFRELSCQHFYNGHNLKCDPAIEKYPPPQIHLEEYYISGVMSFVVEEKGIIHFLTKLLLARIQMHIWNSLYYLDLIVFSNPYRVGDGSGGNG